jgi:type I restriction enzyme M protein
MLIPYDHEDYRIFMAIIEKVGKDRRGVPIYRKDADGAELLFDEMKEWMVYLDNGREIVKSRKVRAKKLDDDLPDAVQAYKNFNSAQQ